MNRQHSSTWCPKCKQDLLVDEASGMVVCVGLDCDYTHPKRKDEDKLHSIQCNRAYNRTDEA
jgi:uncharacterized protein YbaR (Trm112 family)